MDTEIFKKKLGIRLKELRTATGLKQEDLEKWDFSYRYYGRIERGLVNPTVETLLRLCEIFKVRFVDLFSFMDTDGRVSEDSEAVAVMVADILKTDDLDKIRKLKVFLSDII